MNHLQQKITLKFWFQKAKIDEEVRKLPEVSCYLADPEDLLVIPKKIDPGVAAYHECPVPIPYPVPGGPSQADDLEERKRLALKKMSGGDRVNLSRSFYFKILVQMFDSILST